MKKYQILLVATLATLGLSACDKGESPADDAAIVESSSMDSVEEMTEETMETIEEVIEEASDTVEEIMEEMSEDAEEDLSNSVKEMMDK